MPDDEGRTSCTRHSRTRETLDRARGAPGGAGVDVLELLRLAAYEARGDGGGVLRLLDCAHAVAQALLRRGLDLPARCHRRVMSN